MNNGLSDLSLPYVSACLCRLTLLEELFVSLAQSQGLTGKWLPSLKGLTALRKLSFLVGGVRLTDEDLQVVLQGLPEVGHRRSERHGDRLWWTSPWTAGLVPSALALRDSFAWLRLTPKVFEMIREHVYPLPELKELELSLGEIPAVSGTSGRRYVDRKLMDIPTALEPKPVGLNLAYLA